jgi:hypothetical protein
MTTLDFSHIYIIIIVVDSLCQLLKMMSCFKVVKIISNSFDII